MEQEICANCKKEIPQCNYVMHTAHCARNITLCKVCNEPIPKNQFEDHKKRCEKPKPVIKKASPPPAPPTVLENSSYYQKRKSIEDKKIAARRERQIQKYDRLVDSGYSLKDTKTTNNVDTTFKSSSLSQSKPSTVSYDYSGRPISNHDFPKTVENKVESKLVNSSASMGAVKAPSKGLIGLLACKFCDLELPKLDLEEHEDYCGSRTDKCLECGELVMYKHKQLHIDSNHGFVKLKDEPGPKASWDSSTQRSASNTTETSYRRNRPAPFQSFDDYRFDPLPYMPSSYSVPGGPPGIKIEKGESYKEISRRLDCKTEYIRNLLHDSASITVPLRHNGAVPRNHFNHNKGPAPQPPRRRNPPTELVIPCEFCNTPIPHEDLIEHETGCRPDLARFNPRRRSPEEDDYFIAPQPSSPEVELPCEFCADMIPASQLLQHQATCN